MKFPKVLAAFAAMEKSMWRIGDALLDEIPLHEPNAMALMDMVLEELEDAGYAVNSRTLRAYRETAAAFPRARRRTGISFEAHKDAGTPEMLDAIIKVARTKQPTRLTVRETKPIVHQHIARQNREQDHAAGAPPRKPAPRGDRTAIPISKQDTSALRMMAEALRWTNDLEDCDRTIKEITALVAENLTKLDDTEVDHLIEIANDIAKHAHKLNDVAQRLKARHERKGHLNVVGE